MEEPTKKSAVSNLIIVAITSVRPPRVETHAKGLTSAALASKTTYFAVASRESFLLLWLQILFYDLEFLYLLNCLTALFCSPFDLVRFYIFMSCISIFLLLHPWSWSKFECFIFFIVNVFGMIHFLLWINDFYLLFKRPLSSSALCSTQYQKKKGDVWCWSVDPYWNLIIVRVQLLTVFQFAAIEKWNKQMYQDHQTIKVNFNFYFC